MKIKEKLNNILATRCFQETRYISCGQCDSLDHKSKLFKSPIDTKSTLTDVEEIRRIVFQNMILYLRKYEE